MDKVNLSFPAGKLMCIWVRHLVVSPTEGSSRVSGFENNKAVLLHRLPNQLSRGWVKVAHSLYGTTRIDCNGC